jgi:hypothetical protein
VSDPTARLRMSLVTPLEWATLSPDEQAIYLATLNPQGLGLLAGILAPSDPAALLRQWVAAGHLAESDLFVANAAAQRT